MTLKSWQAKLMPHTFLLIADKDLQGNGRLHFDRHFIVVDEAKASKL